MPRDLLPAMLMLKGFVFIAMIQSKWKSLSVFRMMSACKYSLVALVTDVIDSSQRTHFQDLVLLILAFT